MENRIFGHHLVINATQCDIETVTSKEKIEDFSRQLVKAIDMIAYGDPQVVHFAAHNPEAGGYTLIQLIETSNISAHFVDATGNAFIDVFSCKDFVEADAIDVVQKLLKPKQIVHQMFVRAA